MPAFEINGLHVINGEILPVQYELQDPQGEHATADLAFIVRCNNAMIFYYYEQIDKLWIRACLSLGDSATADLQFNHLIFNQKYTAVLGMAPGRVNELISPEHKSDIKNKLISAATEYKAIDECKPVQPAVIAPIIPVVEEEYIGHLSIADRATLNTILLPSGLEKPEIPENYKGTADDWQKAWDKALAHTLSTPPRHFEKNMPANIPDEIKDTLKTIVELMIPGRINKYRFDRSATEDITEKPMIGHVFDDIQQYFYKMLKDATLCPVDKLIKLSPRFYHIPVGKLDEESAQVYTGLSDAQYALMVAFCGDFRNYERYLRNPIRPMAFTVLAEQHYSIEVLQLIIGLMTEGGIKTEAEEQILNDFYAVAFASRMAMDMTEFDERYHSYKDMVFAQLKIKLEQLERTYAEFLAAEDQVAFMQALPLDSATSLVLSLTQEKLLELCGTPGFITEHNIEYIIQALPITALDASMLSHIPSGEMLRRILVGLPSGKAIAVVNQLGADGLMVAVANSTQFSDILNYMPDFLVLAIFETLGNDGIRQVITDAGKLKDTLSYITVSLGNALMAKLEVSHLRTIVFEVSALTEIMPQLTQTSCISLLSNLGADHVKTIFGNVLATQKTSFENALSLFDESFRIRLLFSLNDALGTDFLKQFIRNGGELKNVLRLTPVSSHSSLLRILSDLVDSESLIYALDCIGSDKDLLFYSLGSQRIQAMIQEPYHLCILLPHFPMASRLPLLTALGSTRLIKLVNGQAALTNVYDVLDAASWPDFLDMLGVHHMKYLISSASCLETCFKMILPEESRLPFFNSMVAFLGIEYIKAIIKRPVQLEDLLKYLPSKESKSALIQVLGDNHFNTDVQVPQQLPPALPEVQVIPKVVVIPEVVVPSNVLPQVQAERIIIQDAPSENITDNTRIFLYTPSQQSFDFTLNLKKDWTDIMLPGGVSMGLATGVGIGLALAFSPISMMGSLHMTVGVIIGLAVAAALITMAVYAIAVRSLTTKQETITQQIYLPSKEFKFDIPTTQITEVRVYDPTAWINTL